MPSAADVSLERDDGERASAGRAFRFHYAAPIELTAALPSIVPSVGGVVTVHGRNFPRADALACRFGLNARAVRAVWLNESLIECEAPPAASAEGMVELLVSANGVDWVSDLQVAYEGDRAVSTFTYAGRYVAGCDGHPGGEDHARMADELEPAVRALTGW